MVPPWRIGTAQRRDFLGLRVRLREEHVDQVGDVVEMLARGVYLAPSQFEAGFLSTAHDPGVIEHTLAAADEALAIVARHA